MNRLACALLILLVGCADASRPETADSAAPPAASVAQADWPTAGAVNLRRERSVDLTGDGADERVIIAARGTRADSLDVTLTIVGARRDTLWHDAWPSLHYFKYDSPEGKADSALSRIVRAHVDSLLADDRFSRRGLPARLSQGSGTDEMLGEAVRYHLAELDWRSGADLSPADATPAEGHSRIDPARVVPERVAVVLGELRERPTFWYYAGGEAVYAIAWSAREHAFVRLYSCC